MAGKGQAAEAARGSVNTRRSAATKTTMQLTWDVGIQRSTLLEIVKPKTVKWNSVGIKSSDWWL